MLLEFLRGTAEWAEQENIYRRGIAYVARPIPRPSAPVPAEIKGVAEWLDHVQLPAAGSIEGEIWSRTRVDSSRLAALELEAVDRPSGPVPGSAGANAAAVGPGEAYDAWRRAPDND